MVQFDMPSEVDEYLARLWMLIRPDFTGESVSFTMPTERILASKVNVLMHEKRQRKARSSDSPQLGNGGHPMAGLPAFVVVFGAYGRGISRVQMEDEQQAESVNSGSAASQKRERDEVNSLSRHGSRAGSPNGHFSPTRQNSSQRPQGGRSRTPQKKHRGLR